MKKYKTQQARVLADILCDVCSKSCKCYPDVEDEGCKEERDFELATLSATWGYRSRKDGESYHLDLCEDCFDDVVKHIETRRHQKRKTNE